jgi:hypothetical protein
MGNITKRIQRCKEELKNSAKNTKEKVDKVKAVGRKYGLPKELVNDFIRKH